MRLAGTNHVNFAVSDLDRSVSWYERVFLLVPGTDEASNPPVDGSTMRYRGLFDPGTGMYIIGLIEHGTVLPEFFDEHRPGLDHFAFHVPEVGDLEAWARHLDAIDVAHSGIQRSDYGASISLRDPDNIQLELFAPDLSFWLARMEAAKLAQAE